MDDVVCTVLGCNTLLILRPASNSPDSFELVGECYFYGLMCGESLLGPLPFPWKRRREGSSVPFKPDIGVYWNSEANELTSDDPRLPPLPSEWEKVERERGKDDPIIFTLHRNKLTGELINSDPRMLPDALRERGVELEEFRLI